MHKYLIILVSTTITLNFLGCKDVEEKENEKTNQTSKNEGQSDELVLPMGSDDHSYANIKQVKTNHIHMDMNVDFDSKQLKGEVRLDIENMAKTDSLILDVDNLHIQHVTLDDGSKANFKIGKRDPIFGSPMLIKIKPNTKSVTIAYETDPNSKALQWLSPEQTAGKQHPYLFTQGQAILTRSWIPTQDAPALRITYSADIHVPSELMAVMSASNPLERSESGDYHFEMKQSIPAYLIALAVGDLEFRAIGERTGVYTEPKMAAASENEFADMEKMLIAAEGMYGKYKWERYDVIVLPPSFPFGGMENPRLTFATPTILAGDKSLVSLIAHEMAHSWSGNLVTNASWDDFWLNEGFTVYFENRIMEEVYGKDYADMLMLISEQDLRKEIEELDERDTHLKLDLEDRDPDEGLTAIAYDKGAFFLKMLENAAGRKRWDEFLKNYFQEHQFETITTEKFVKYLNKNLIEPENLDVNIDEWIYGPGLPASHIKIMSEKFAQVDQAVEAMKSGKDLTEIAFDASDWAYQQNLHFIRSIPADYGPDKMAEIDKAFGYSRSGNSEILAEWLVQSIRRGYDVDKETTDFLTRVGRRKFLTPIYSELIKTDQGKKRALEIYEMARPNYHSVSYITLDEMLDYEPK
jgi:aminopeptidase N